MFIPTSNIKVQTINFLVTLARKATTSILDLRNVLTSSVRFVKCCSTSVTLNHLASTCGIRCEYSVSTSSKSCLKSLYYSGAAVMELADFVTVFKTCFNERPIARKT